LGQLLDDLGLTYVLHL